MKGPWMTSVSTAEIDLVTVAPCVGVIVTVAVVMVLVSRRVCFPAAVIVVVDVGAPDFVMVFVIVPVGTLKHLQAALRFARAL